MPNRHSKDLFSLNEIRTNVVIMANFLLTKFDKISSNTLVSS